MVTALLETQKAAITVVVFFATFFLALSLGRLLKRRAGVRLGILFQVFSLTLAFYAAMAFFGVETTFQKHLGAAAVLLSTAFLVALIDRYVWDFYFEKKQHAVIPKFLREVVALVIFLIVLLFVLSFGYHADKQLKGILTGSGIAAIIIGFAGQNLFGGIIAGISLQINRPYKAGDWLQLQDRFAEVMEINWRSTRLRTTDAIYLDIPNNEIVRQTIVNLHYPTPLHAMRLRVGVDYNTPPNRVKDSLLRAATTAEGVVPEPAPKIYVADFADSAVLYEIKFWMGNHAAYSDICDAIRTNIWYEFKRQRITIPFPIRTLQVQRKPAATELDQKTIAQSILRGEPLFGCLEDSQLASILGQAQINHFGRGERLIQEGAAGESMFILLQGTAQVSVARNGSNIRVGVLRSGDCFGEMSLLTGEKRTATIRAEDDCEVLEIGKPVMAEIFRAAPECMQQLSELLAERKLETDGIVRDSAQPQARIAKEREYRATFLQRLRTVFEL